MSASPSKGAKAPPQTTITESRASPVEDVLRAQRQLRDALGVLRPGVWDENEQDLWRTYFNVQREIHAREDLVKYHLLHSHFTAAHEAGHATFALKECRFLKLAGVDILTNPTTRSLGGCSFLNWQTAIEEEDAEALATLCMAGGEAGRLAAERTGLSLPVEIFGDASDREWALKILDPKMKWTPSQECESLGRLSARARGFLETNWELVIRVAMLLIQKGRLTADEVRALVI